ncbi:MAG TPA: BrnT family toxin [Candidatus Obscuribacterales bacterium]
MSDTQGAMDRRSLRHGLLVVTIGIDAFGRVLVVVYTLRGDEIRLISARKATRREQQQYEEE